MRLLLTVISLQGKAEWDSANHCFRLKVTFTFAPQQWHKSRHIKSRCFCWTAANARAGNGNFQLRAEEPPDPNCLTPPSSTDSNCTCEIWPPGSHYSHTGAGRGTATSHHIVGTSTSVHQLWVKSTYRDFWISILTCLRVEAYYYHNY